MKKLITAAMALAMAAGMASAVESANIVGYVTITNASGNTYSSYGSSFITVGDLNTNSTLGDITADGMSAGVDTIQFLDPVSLSVTLTATYVDFASGGAEFMGWWDPSIENRLDTTALPAGTGFLCNIGSGNTVVFTFTGEVVQDTIALDLTGQTYPMVANTVPADLTLGDITADGMSAGVDTIQFLDPVSLSVTLTATYVDFASGGAEFMGWWDPSIENRLDTTALPAGTAFLCNLGSGNPVLITFPSPIAP